MKKVFLLFTAFLMISSVWAQATVGEPDPASIGVDSAQQKLQIVSVDKFESAGFWNVYMSPDEGIVSGRQFVGGPAGKLDEPNPEERYTGIDPKVADQYSYGVSGAFKF